MGHNIFVIRAQGKPFGKEDIQDVTRGFRSSLDSVFRVGCNSGFGIRMNKNADGTVDIESRVGGGKVKTVGEAIRLIAELADPLYTEAVNAGF